MKVFKFGGASVKDASGVKNMTEILHRYRGEPLLIVVSAMGKTTNHLEALTRAYFQGLPEKMQLYHEIRDFHLAVCQDLFGRTDQKEVLNILDKLLAIIDPEQEENSAKDLLFDYVYDLIVPAGELLSTQIISSWMRESGIPHQLLDAREYILTDHTYREGKVLWDISAQKILDVIPGVLEKGQWVITQGFIGGTTDRKSVTLGREGSDYSAAIFSNILDAEACYIWKDVPGLMNADPKRIPEASKIDRISYGEAIELAYYGASVIHPKTLKPLQNKSIPLYVKSFLDPESPGTEIREELVEARESSFIFKDNQALISISPKDYSFIAEDNIYAIFGFISRYHVRVNMMQNSAISFSICIDENEKTLPLISSLSKSFNVRYNTGLQLITLRHYTPEQIEKLVKDKGVLLEQRSRTTLQMVVRV
ncbi:MAG: aspartate kinase [Bacteroidetes bacterium]|nr:aspartate kinase [Bacteroidota bacterium]